MNKYKFNKINKVVKNSFSVIFYFTVTTYLFFFSGRLKAMWLYGESIMAEPNKFISFLEFYICVLLTMSFTYITVNQIIKLF